MGLEGEGDSQLRDVCYEEDKAIEYYKKFLDLWKDANPGITKVEEARERVAGLKSNN